MFNVWIALAFTLFTSGCFLTIRDPKIEDSPQTAQPSEPLPAVTPSSPPLTYASGWDEMVILANSAKTRVSPAAHFATSRNACGREAYGAIALNTWNPLALGANAAATASHLQEGLCFPVPETPRYLDGSVQLKLKDGKTMTLFELRGAEICGILSNSQTASQLLTAIHQVIELADQEDCPHGWGS
ncbi:MAG: hypothetical protein ACO3A2_05885 [Bdellovibrionia bacterium]